MVLDWCIYIHFLYYRSIALNAVHFVIWYYHLVLPVGGGGYAGGGCEAIGVETGCRYAPEYCGACVWGGWAVPWDGYPDWLVTATETRPPPCRKTPVFLWMAWQKFNSKICYLWKVGLLGLLTGKPYKSDDLIPLWSLIYWVKIGQKDVTVLELF